MTANDKLTELWSTQNKQIGKMEIQHKLDLNTNQKFSSLEEPLIKKVKSEPKKDKLENKKE